MADAPLKINLGSGRDFRTRYLNIDISDLWDPDVVADISVPHFAQAGKTFITRRFGPVIFGPGTFEEIVSSHVLEHVPDLVTTMTNCLELLKVGGLFSIAVPYDLSYGAWQDPTHLRAFNERSWVYYTDWFWYLGWQTHRFVLRTLEFEVSPEGNGMLQAGLSKDVLIRTPRAVDAMKVTLEKIPLSDADRQAAKAMQIRQEL